MTAVQVPSPPPKEKKNWQGPGSPTCNARSQKAETGHPRVEWLSRSAKSAELQNQSKPASINGMKSGWGTQ